MTKSVSQTNQYEIKVKVSKNGQSILSNKQEEKDIRVDENLVPKHKTKFKISKEKEQQQHVPNEQKQPKFDKREAYREQEVAVSPTRPDILKSSESIDSSYGFDRKRAVSRTSVKDIVAKFEMQREGMIVPPIQDSNLNQSQMEEQHAKHKQHHKKLKIKKPKHANERDEVEIEKVQRADIQLRQDMKQSFYQKSIERKVLDE
jgi:hypothetical protein